MAKTKTLVAGGWRNPAQRARVPNGRVQDPPPRVPNIPTPGVQPAGLTDTELTTSKGWVFPLCPCCGVWTGEAYDPEGKEQPRLQPGRDRCDCRASGLDCAKTA